MLRSSFPRVAGLAGLARRQAASASRISSVSSTTSPASLYHQARRSFASVTPPRAEDPTKLDQITTLPNGLRVASEALPGAFSGVGVYIHAGSRFENDYLRGAGHILDRLAFKSTTARSADAMLEAVEQLGGNIQCASSRESMMYQAATFNAAIPTAVEILAETIRHPLLSDEEIAQQVDTAAYEIKEIMNQPYLLLPELLHMAAFKDNTLGNPLLCPEDRLGAIDAAVLRTYRAAFYRPERTVVAFAGVSHDDAVRLADQFFGDMPRSDLGAGLSTEDQASTTSTDTAASTTSTTGSTATTASSFSSAAAAATTSEPSKLLSKIPFLKNISTSATQHNAAVLSSSAVPPSSSLSAINLTEPARYTGGFLSMPSRPPPPNPNQQQFAHIQLAFEGVPIDSEDIYALATLQTLLGGGGSFSAGGPGKGMYSRLYTNVLNQHGWVDSCVAFNHAYTDSGLFGIAASCYPGHTARMLDVLCRELRALTLDAGAYGALGAAEVSRAKNQLRSSLLMNLESRMVELEDLGYQVQVHGRKIPVHEMVRRINALTPDDLRRVARTVLHGLVANPGSGSGAPTVVLDEAGVLGTGAKALQWDEIQDVIARWQLGRR